MKNTMNTSEVYNVASNMSRLGNTNVSPMMSDLSNKQLNTTEVYNVTSNLFRIETQRSIGLFPTDGILGLLYKGLMLVGFGIIAVAFINFIF